ncbi:metalloregulator ArsR/SmtB family transcription factor [Sphingomonas sp. RP10(2022)]|uniref:Metalloregulator ArsR/SmtB family transcription factor n=1 Tax=Sphingomonas liriopis TaxID=2949094 RepID=A0A9X2KQY0_9SPHN|nr:metalloregulator ArsR/SmtB family transcription factor [Sphingomonas liriopis]MCP3735026.1 metalloregulator ArsR/SmtB family transcription factor [Sphingomonas liriopis]
MPKPVQAAHLFAALADPTRLALLVTLRSGTARPIARLSANAGMTRQAVTKHLRILEDAGLVTVTRTGRETHYTYRPGSLDAAGRYLDAIAGRWGAVGRTDAGGSDPCGKDPCPSADLRDSSDSGPAHRTAHGGKATG